MTESKPKYTYQPAHNDAIEPIRPNDDAVMTVYQIVMAHLRQHATRIKINFNTGRIDIIDKK